MGRLPAAQRPPRLQTGPPFAAWVPHLWDGPTGPFLVPFGALASARRPVTVSVYAEPCELTTDERRWLGLVRYTSRTAAMNPSNFHRLRRRSLITWPPKRTIGSSSTRG